MRTLHRIPNRVVVKIGTDSINSDVIVALAEQLAEVRTKVSQIVVVSSGAMHYGRLDQDVERSDRETFADKQYFASIGQPKLMAAYTDAFSPHGISVVQGLMTWDDFDSKSRRARLRKLFTRIVRAEKPAIPVINENDFTEIDEFRRFSDNDHLAAEVAKLINAGMVLFLTTTNGLLRSVGDESSRIATVQCGDSSWRQFVQPTSSRNGKGGMMSKCKRASLLARKGIDAVIANAQTPKIVPRVFLQGESLGTHFIANSTGRVIAS